MSLSGPAADAPSFHLLVDGLASIRDNIFASPVTTTKLDTVQGYTYYDVKVQDADNYTVQEVYGTLNTLFSTQYTIKNDVQGDNVSQPLKATWTSGSQTSASYTTGAQGCGSASGYMVAKNISASTPSQVGTTAGGAKLYQLPVSAPLFGAFYKDYTDNSTYLPANVQNMSQQQYQDAHALLLVQNALGEWVVYQRSDMVIRGGCGKPVIYLYPQQPTVASVQVDADIRRSAPMYVPNAGWQKVLALPNGQLLYNGSSYGSLYWEGYGAGTYPQITSGTVVPRNQVVSTIRMQLAQQGLTTAEINDFMTFWQPKLPATPYTRLTWLTKAQLDQLAPLHITPQPQTVIRVFLDFAGLDQPLPLPSQHFSAPQRQGFTAVEWGGLLRNGIQ